jgi:hypothetical protein
MRRMNPEHADQKGIPQRLADKTGHQITLTMVDAYNGEAPQNCGAAATMRSC